MELKKLVIDSNKNIIALQIAGRIRSGYLSAVESELNSFSGGPPVFVILDLTGIEGIDSTGIGMLIKARTDITQAGGNIVLLAGGRVETVIKLSGLENYFKMAGTQEEAIELLNQPPEPPATSSTEPSSTEEAEND
jgi:anti-anti-sigma factor